MANLNVLFVGKILGQIGAPFFKNGTYLVIKADFPFIDQETGQQGGDPLGDRIQFVIMVPSQPLAVSFKDQLVILDDKKTMDIEILCAQPFG